MSNPSLQNSTPEASAAFAPNDPVDGRYLGEWKSKYPPDALREIRFEAIYVAGVFIAYFSSLVAMLYLSTDGTYVTAVPEDGVTKLAVLECGSVSDKKLLSPSFLGFCCAWAAGGVGGSLFSLKWMYHCVAKQIWHQDRRLWRILTPHLSAVLAFCMILIVSSGFIKVFAENIAIRHIDVMAFSFLVGYFSDKALAKLAEVADTLFGSNRKVEGK